MRLPLFPIPSMPSPPSTPEPPITPRDPSVGVHGAVSVGFLSPIPNGCWTAFEPVNFWDETVYVRSGAEAYHPFAPGDHMPCGFVHVDLARNTIRVTLYPTMKRPPLEDMDTFWYPLRSGQPGFVRFQVPRGVTTEKLYRKLADGSYELARALNAPVALRPQMSTAELWTRVQPLVQDPSGKGSLLLDGKTVVVYDGTY